MKVIDKISFGFCLFCSLRFDCIRPTRDMVIIARKDKHVRCDVIAVSDKELLFHIQSLVCPELISSIGCGEYRNISDRYLSSFPSSIGWHCLQAPVFSSSPSSPCIWSRTRLAFSADWNLPVSCPIFLAVHTC